MNRGELAVSVDSGRGELSNQKVMRFLLRQATFHHLIRALAEYIGFAEEGEKFGVTNTGCLWQSCFQFINGLRERTGLGLVLTLELCRLKSDSNEHLDIMVTSVALKFFEGEMMVHNFRGEISIMASSSNQMLVGADCRVNSFRGNRDKCEGTYSL